MRANSLSLAVVLLVACVGGSGSDLPLVAAPTTPLPTQPGAAALTAVSPTTLTGEPGSTTLVQVRATRADGAPVNGVVVVFQVQAGGGSVQPASTTTAGEGIASVKWTFGTTPGVNLLGAVGGFVPSPLAFTASTLPETSDRGP
jgi:hypothetical protein